MLAMATSVTIEYTLNVGKYILHPSRYGRAVALYLVGTGSTTPTVTPKEISR